MEEVDSAEAEKLKVHFGMMNNDESDFENQAELER